MCSDGLKGQAPMRQSGVVGLWLDLRTLLNEHELPKAPNTPPPPPSIKGLSTQLNVLGLFESLPLLQVKVWPSAFVNPRVKLNPRELGTTSLASSLQSYLSSELSLQS